jgi:LPXTG-motif cell wall-anchored protein
MMNFNGMITRLALDVDLPGGKQLFGSLINDGSLIVIGAIAALAIAAAILLFLRKKKKDREKSENA